MIATRQLIEALQRQLAGTPRFLVSAEVRPGGKAVVEVDNEEAPITLAELTEINKRLQAEFGEAMDDVEMQVGSPGVGRPFKVEQQYRKYAGKKVEVVLAEGRHVQGLLEGHDAHGIRLRLLLPGKVKGRPQKASEETTVIPFTGIKAVQADININ